MRTIIMLFAFVMLTQFFYSQDFKDLDKSPMDAIIVRDDNNAPLLRVIYSRPKKRGREIFGGLVPFNKIWRTGANESTEITFYQPMCLGDHHIEKGTYTLYTIPQKKQWTIIINKLVNTWGTFNYDKDLDEVRFDVETNSTPSTIEVLSMKFKQVDEGADLIIGWEKTFVEVPFRFVHEAN